MTSQEIIFTPTTIVTLVSDTCNKTKELRTIIDKISDVITTNTCDHKLNCIYKEILNEIENPVIIPLTKALENYKLCVLQETLDKVDREVIPIMSTYELDNYNKLKQRLTIIKCDPSERFMSLTSKRWGPHNKREFGTADKLGLSIVTGNQGVTKEILLQKQWPMNIITHRSRDIIGKKLECVNILY